VYQAIHFDYRNYTCHLRDDQEGWVSFPYKPTYYRQDPEGEYWTLDGKRVSPTQDVDKEDISVYEKDVDINLRILLDLYKDEDEPASYQNKLFFDIEAEMGGAINLEYCQSAPSRITAVAMYDFNLKEYSAFILDDTATMKESLKDNVRVIPCHTETGLLMKVIDKWKEIDPTIITGWNIDNFDVPYMYNRMKKLLGERKANELSPIGVVKFDDFDTKMPYKIAGVNSLDYMRLYKKFIPKQQPSYGLDFIGKKEIGRGKIQYEGSLDKLFKEDIDKFIEYNINDVSIIVDLDEKRKFIDLAVSVCHIGHVPYYYVYQSSKLLDGVIMTHLKRKGIVSPNRPTTMDPSLKKSIEEEGEDDDKFAGAYVKDPVPGLYGWNIDLDEQSLYPLTILQLNASPETFIFKIVTDDPFDMSWTLKQMKDKDGEKEVQVMKRNWTVTTIKLKNLIKFIEDNECTVAPNGTVYSTDQVGMICEVVEQWFMKRNDYKNEMKKYGKMGDKVKYDFYNTFQGIYKILLNSIYGVLGLKSFRYSDGRDIMAESVTISGRFIITQTADYINEKINKELGD
jgi:DNA polymerase elongation subunit (family B)